MDNKILSSITSLGIGIFLLFIGIKGLWPNFILNQNEEIALGVFFTVVGFIMLVWQILGARNENILIYGTVIMGILLLVIGIFFMSKNSSFGIAIAAPGFVLFLRSFILLLKKKFPNQEFFGRKL